MGQLREEKCSMLGDVPSYPCSVFVDDIIRKIIYVDWNDPQSGYLEEPYPETHHIDSETNFGK